MKNPSEIIAGLYLGNDKNSEVDSHGYSFIVNCTPNLQFHIAGTDRVRIHIEDDPYDSFPLYQILRDTDVLDQMHNHLMQGKTVFVHCQAGAQRSPAVTACYLMKYHGMSGDEAIRFIKSKRPEAFFWTINLQRAINLFEEFINLNVGSAI
jgi:protein-tyrosine phosphatase